MIGAAAIVCAAGKGERAGFAENKVLHELNGLPVLAYSLSAFSAAGIDEIFVVCRKEDEEEIRVLLSPYPLVRTVIGGETRTESVYNALQLIKSEIVLVHDAARPFVTQKLITDCVDSVRRFGSGVCALPATDTVVIAENGEIVSAPERDCVFSVQTPQGFYTEKLLAAYNSAMNDRREKVFTDDSGIYAKYLERPRVFLGDRSNVKLTYPEDFLPAQRVGFGVDTHAFGKDQPYITLAGVKIPSASGLIAHSDGDVLVHALMDALLSAAGLRDIGYYFPDTDETYAGANSMELLKDTLALVSREGLSPQNVSIAVLAEQPRLLKHIENMKQNLASVLSLPSSAIGIAAGTNEKLGYVGEGKGITVYATVLLKSESK